MDWLKETTISDALTKSADVVGAFVLNEPELVFYEALCGILLIILVLVLLRKNKTPQGEQDEMKRRTHLESVYADKVHDFMLDMLMKEEITRKEYKRDCRRFGIAFRLLDLLRPVRSKIGIKHKVLRNIAVNHSTLPFIQAGKIPGPKPGEDVPVPPSKPKRKVWVVVGKRRSAA